MCLIAIAHRASQRYPLIVAANRDEDLARPTLDATWWDDNPQILGGRDGLHGGTWLAISRGGRWAAVTNLRGSAKTAQSKSRGALVRDFVAGDAKPRDYIDAIDRSEYAGFHLFAGEIGGDVAYLSPTHSELLAPGVHGVSNAPVGEHWPKVDYAIDAVRAALESANPVDDLLRFLRTPRNSGAIESEVFISTPRYGTRASTVIVAMENEIVFCEDGRTFTIAASAIGR